MLGEISGNLGTLPVSSREHCSLVMNDLKVAQLLRLTSHAKVSAPLSIAFENMCHLPQAIVLLEHTGHYHRLLEQYLIELDITVYRVHVQKRAEGLIKTDKRDALGLANTLYTQLELGAQVRDKMQLVRRIVPPTSAAAQLQSVMRHRYELSHMSTQYRNKLTAICDQLFPELVQIFHDPNLPTALAIRSAFPTPHAVAEAPLNDLHAVRQRHFPSEAQLLHLQKLARETIGITNLDRQRSLVLEQGLLIKELRLIQEHLENLRTTITDIVQNCREGQILLSIPPIGPVEAAAAIAAVGNIANFAKASELKAYACLGSEKNTDWGYRGSNQSLKTRGPSYETTAVSHGCAGDHP